MTKFKQTPIGEIPEDWEVMRLGDKEIGKLKDGDWILKKYYTSEGVRLLQVGDIGIGRFLDKSNRFISYDSAKKLSCTFVRPKEDILISRMPEPIGRACIAPELPYPYIVAVDITILKVNKKRVDKRFLVYILNSPKILAEAMRLSAGATRSRISRKNLENLLIPLPPLPEQHKIAEILSTVDNAIQKVSAVIAKTERLKRGLMQELLTKGIINGFMFDTNIFDAILDGKISVDQLPTKYNYYITHIQKDEIENIKKTEKLERRSNLLEIFKKLEQNVILTETTVFDISRWDNSKFGEGDLYDRILLKLQELDEKTGKKTKENQIRDALIAETSIKNNLILVSNDKNLRLVTTEFGGHAITFEQFLKGEYRKFKDSEIGRIPEEWEVVRLVHANIEVIDGDRGVNYPKQSDFSNKGFCLFLNAKNVTESGFKFTETQFISKEKDSKMGKGKLKRYDIVLTTRGTIGNVGYYDDNVPYEHIRINSGMVILRNKNKNIDNKFLCLLFRTPFLKTQIKRIAYGTAQPQLNVRIIKNFKIPLPPLPEQQKIAEILSTMDKKLELEKKRKEKLERIKKGLMNDLLTGRRRVKI
jgi:restriction endonuclease S subunit